MAATIAEATGYDSTRTKVTHRLGSRAAHVRAATWSTFAEAQVNADGSGSFTLKDDGGRTLAYVTWNTEAAPVRRITLKAANGTEDETGALRA